MIEILNFSKSYQGNLIFSIQHLVLPDKGIVAIKGENGCGKTTFLNILSLMDSQYQGDVFLFGKDIKTFSQKQKANIRKNDISYVFQKKNLVSFCDVDLNERIYDSYSKRKKDKRKANTLSQGQQEIIALKRSLKYRKKIYLFDEVLSSLDEKNRKAFLEQVIKLSKHSLVILVSHDVYLDQIADEVLSFENKNVKILKQYSESEERNELQSESYSYKLNIKEICFSFLSHFKWMMVLNFVLTSLMLMLGYVGCESVEPDRLSYAFSALKDEDYIVIPSKQNRTSLEIISNFKGNAYEAAFTDFPLVYSSEVKNDGKVYCNQSTYNFLSKKKNEYFKENSLLVDGISYDIVIDDSLGDSFFYLNEKADDEFFCKMYHGSWNTDFSGSLAFYSETAFKSLFKKNQLPSALKDNVFYVSDFRLVSDNITSYDIPSLDNNDYQPDLNDVFDFPMSSQYFQMDSSLIEKCVVMSDNTAKLLQSEYRKHRPVMVYVPKVKSSLAFFLSQSKYTIQSVFNIKNKKIYEFDSLIGTICDSTNGFTYSIFVWSMLVLVLLFEGALFSYLLYLEANDIHILYSLGLSKSALFGLLFLPFAISLVLSSLTGGLLSLAAISFKVTSFLFGGIYTVSIFAISCISNIMIFLRRMK